LAAVRRAFAVAPAAEVTVEMDPGTFSGAKAAALAAAGVTRASIGVQALDDRLLAAANRPHTAAEAVEAVGRAAAAGLAVSVDLMCGLPGQSRGAWRASLAAAAALRPAHVSAYALELHAGTRWGRTYTAGVAPLPGEAAVVAMVDDATEVLGAAGLARYEVSNWAVPGSEAVHNGVYWRNGGYYAVGVGATSYVGRRRYTRPRTLGSYFAYVRRVVAEGVDAVHAEVAPSTDAVRWGGGGEATGGGGGGGGRALERGTGALGLVGDPTGW